MKKMILIHTALKHEAKPIIEYFKLQCIETKPYKVYNKDNIVLIVTGMGAKNTLHVESIFGKYDIQKAINIGIAGCKDKSVDIGSIFCTNKQLDSIAHATITTVDLPLSSSENLKTTLVDMEANIFIDICQKFLHIDDIYVLKIVSDYLDTTIPKKEFIWKIIEKNLKNISQIVTS